MFLSWQAVLVKDYYLIQKKIPKPMLKINKKPIIENIILKLLKQGFEKFYISTHYKSKFIKDYFKRRKILELI